MFLVKSCFRKDNATRVGTIKIGTLIEYRHTEQKQIADIDEGKFEINLDLVDVHIEEQFFNFINYSHNSYASLYIEKWHTAGMSNVVPGCLFVKKYEARIQFLNLNRFTFCISYLGIPEYCTDIFPDYDDYWYFNAKLSGEIAASMALSLRDEILQHEKRGEKIFIGDYDIDYLEVHPSIQSISYQDRQLSVNNEFFYRNIKLIYNSLVGIAFLKPLSFHQEKEIRFIFDFHCKGKLLHPKVKMIIIKVPEAISGLLHSM